MKFYGKNPPTLILYKVDYKNGSLGFYWAENVSELITKVKQDKAILDIQEVK